jgi:hypothetical protein
MNLTGRLKAVEKRTAARRTNPACLTALKADRSAVLKLAKVVPDRWQRDLLRAKPHRAICLCCRQSGKSTYAAADCLATALTQPGSLTLICSPTLRQSTEVFRKCVALWRLLGRPVGADAVNKTSLELVNGARIIALPGDPDGLVGFSNPALVVVDEAARAPDELFFSLRPMLALGGRMLLTSTPFGPRGFFFQEWTEGGSGWKRAQVKAADCPRIGPAFLADERRALGAKWFAQEYETSFEAATGAVFDPQDILDATRFEPWMAA